MSKKPLIKKANFQDWLDRQPLKEYFVSWDSVSESQLNSLIEAIDTSTTEAPIQQYFERNPNLLIEHLGGGHGRFVIPQKRLGAEFVPDFVVGEKSSIGYEWYLLELESPRARLFTRAGKQSAELTTAINQIQQWRAWLAVNQNYAARDRSEGGLGLEQVSTSPPGLILIGRRALTDESTNRLRRQIAHETRIAIHTYDFIIDTARAKRRAI